MEQAYWKSALREDPYDPPGMDCRFCAQSFTTVGTRRAHEGYHLTDYRCAECPDRIWRRVGNARGHNRAHHISTRYHAPRQLAGCPELLPRWAQAQLEPRIVIRRVATLDEPVQEVTTGPPPKESDQESGPPAAELEEIEVDLLQQVLNSLEQDEAGGAWEITTQLTMPDEGPHPTPTNQTGVVTSGDAQYEHISAARRDIADARRLLDSASGHLDGIEACLMMEGAYNLWANEDW